ncbi:unnamed protein product [Brassica oleracea]|uniref:RING-type domain-containing protein n=1 Tax=Brassica carinata TaxID=52824 RepID=A0A8X7WSA7_BRACI|nr:hypothetical protein Bca52824_005956 [Brassica carinata]
MDRSLKRNGPTCRENGRGWPISCGRSERYRTFELKANAEDVELHLMEESKGWRTSIPKSINEPVKECSICFEDLSDVDEESIELHDCSNEFHKVCLFQWIWSKSSCPLCRHPIYCGKPKS